MGFVLLLAVVAAIVVYLVWRSGRKQAEARENDAAEVQRWYDAKVRLAKDPKTDPAVLRGILAMENPHDRMFFARLAVLRVLAQNPSLPAELQAAAINRVSQEEAAARMDKSLKAIAKSSGGARGFVGFGVDF